MKKSVLLALWQNWNVCRKRALRDKFLGGGWRPIWWGGHWMDWCVVFIEWTNLTVLADCNVPRHAWLTPSVGVPDMLHFVAPYKVFRFLYLWTHNVINASVQKYNSYPVTVLVYFGTLPDAASWDKVTDTCKTQYLLLPWSHGRWRHYVLYRQMRKWILIRDTVKHHMYS